MVEIGPGELLDRMTILEIKQARFKDPDKASAAATALAKIQPLVLSIVADSLELRQLKAHLKTINEKLWDVENEIRALDGKQDFGSEFVSAARSIYRFNDERAALKRRIDAELSSANTDIKEYAP
jgi:predicted  nucleic acid-binding Zn-ribbon protein